jgi:DNA polymerase-3 subunit alpha/error-prone DNA polymerase
MRRVRLNRDDVVALCPAGVFDSIAGGMSRALQARALLKDGAASGRAGKGQAELFTAEAGSGYGVSGPNTAVLAPVREKAVHGGNELWEEYAALGFLRRLHPLALWKDKIEAMKRIKAAWLSGYVGRRVKLIGWPVTQKEVWTKDGLTMSFLTFEDETALYETVIFPKVYERYGKLLFDQRPLVVWGQVAEDWGAVSVEVDRVEGL